MVLTPFWKIRPSIDITGNLQKTICSSSFNLIWVSDKHHLGKITGSVVLFCVLDAMVFWESRGHPVEGEAVTVSSASGRRMNWFSFPLGMSHNTQHMWGELFPGTAKERAPWRPEFSLLESLVVSWQVPGWNHNRCRDTAYGSGADCPELEGRCLFWKYIHRCPSD